MPDFPTIALEPIVIVCVTYMSMASKAPISNFMLENMTILRTLIIPIAQHISYYLQCHSCLCFRTSFLSLQPCLFKMPDINLCQLWALVSQEDVTGRYSVVLMVVMGRMDRGKGRGCHETTEPYKCIHEKAWRFIHVIQYERHDDG